MNDHEFITEIVVRKVGDKYEAQWSGDVELSGHGQSAPEALVDLVEFLMDPPSSRLSIEEQKIEGAVWDSIQQSKFIARVKAMSHAERFSAMVAAGIYTPDGELTAEYREE